MNKFERGKIYTIRSHKTPLIYVGSTTEKYLSNRMGKHRSSFKRYKNGNVGYCASFDILEIDTDCYIELYEYYPCNTDLELKRREGEVIRSLDCVNKRIAGRTAKEWREDNKERINAKSKEYYDDNKDEIAANRKQYRANNKERINAKKKQYYNNNKEQINAKSKQKHDCECGGKYITANKSRHMKTKKHQAFINQ